MKNTIAAAASYLFCFFVWTFFTIAEISELNSHLIGEAKIGMVLYTAIGFLLVTIFFFIALTFKFEKKTKWILAASYLIAIVVLVLFHKVLQYNSTLVIYP